MEENYQEIQIKSIQKTLNYCIDEAYVALSDNLYKKIKCLDNAQILDFHQKEYQRVRDKLTDLYSRNPEIASIEDFYSDPNFLWESFFIESMNREDKHKYFIYAIKNFVYSKFCKDHAIYDQDLPFFSKIVEAVSLEKFSVLLMNNCNVYKDALREEREANDRFFNKIFAEESSCTKEKSKSSNPNNSKDFEHTFTDIHFELLTECINKTKLFRDNVTKGDVIDIFNCHPQKIQKSSNNRVLAYLFDSLATNYHNRDNRQQTFITSEWQSVISNNQLFFSSIKNSFLNQGDLSSAICARKNMNSKGKYAIIDNYIKEMKKA